MRRGLARPGEDEEVKSLRLKAAVALSLLVGSGRVSDSEADQLYEQITYCGPTPQPQVMAA